MTAPRSRTIATWLALLGGGLGLHRFYLRGLRDPWGWMHPLPTLLAGYGWWRVTQLGLDDRWSWLLLPLGGLSISAGMLAAIVCGLMPQDRWDLRYNHGGASPSTGWSAVGAVVLALLLGSTVFLSSVTYGLQRYFETQLEAAHDLSR
jgi:hypothetical protein